MQDKLECYGWRSRREMGADPQWCIDTVNMWTRVRHLKRFACRSSGQPLSQSWLAAVKLYHPLVDTNAYVVSSDVSLSGHICTHVCLFYVLQRDVSLASSSVRTSTFKLVTSAMILCPRQDLVDSQASQPFSFVDVCTQTC